MSSVYDFLNAYNLELKRREDLVIRLDFTSKMFTDYLFETILGTASVIAAMYLSMNGMMILGIGQAIIVGLYIYSTITRKQSKAAKVWPPKFSPCPNGFLEVMDHGMKEIICHRIGVENPSGNDVFVPYGKTKDQLCRQAQNGNLYWDQC